jgi:aspartate aminotransferase
MTGWRIGYTGGPKEIIAAMRKAQSQNTSSPNSIAQYAAEAALNGSQACVAEMTKAYKERHDYLYSALQTIPGINCIPSDGTFYNFPDVSGLIARLDGVNNDVDLAELLLNKAEVAVIPGTAFGGVNHIRLCYTTSMPKLIEAVERMKRVFLS